MSHNSSRDFGGSNIFGNNSNVSDSQSQWNQNNNNNNNNDNKDDDNSSFQPSVRGVTDQYYDRPLIPTTVKKILSSPDPEPDEAFTIDGKPVHQVSIIGYLRSITPNTTHTVFEIDDQCSYKTPNGWIKCKLWSSDNDDLKQMEQEELRINDMVKIIGKIDTFRSRRSINIHFIGKIKDKNEVYLHYLEAIMAKEFNELLMNQHIPSYKQQLNQYMESSQNEHQADKQKYNQYKQKQQQQQQQQQMGYNNNNNNSNNRNNHDSPPQFGQNRARNYNQNRFAQNRGHNNNNNNNNYNNNRNHNNRNYKIDEEDERKLNQLQRNILNWLRANDNSVGHSTLAIKQGVKCYNDQSVKEAMKKLYQHGFIQDTIDDHYRVVIEENK